jgi:hypothetical protein
VVVIAPLTVGNPEVFTVPKRLDEVGARVVVPTDDAGRTPGIDPAGAGVGGPADAPATAVPSAVENPS